MTRYKESAESIVTQIEIGGSQAIMIQNKKNQRHSSRTDRSLAETQIHRKNKSNSKLPQIESKIKSSAPQKNISKLLYIQRREMTFNVISKLRLIKSPPSNFETHEPPASRS